MVGDVVVVALVDPVVLGVVVTLVVVMVVLLLTVELVMVVFELCVEEVIHDRNEPIAYLGMMRGGRTCPAYH